MCISLLFGVKNVAAQSSPDVSEKREIITVSATVLPTEEFLRLLGQRSRVSLEKKAFTVGQSVRVAVHVTTGGRERFARHTLVLSVSNAHGEKVVTLSGVTDSTGQAVFDFIVDKRFLGENTLRVIDTAYGTPVTLGTDVLCVVYEEAEDTEHEQARKGVVSSGERALSHVSPEAFSMHSAENSENGGTMTIQNSRRLSRVGSADP